MLLRVLFVCAWSAAWGSKACYWNRECKHQLFASKTPYDSVRGDLREQPALKGCEAVSVWALMRHGNRNPGVSTLEGIRQVLALRGSILRSHARGRGQLCAQDIQNLRKFTWNHTVDESASFLTGEGYEELFEIGQRIRSRYPHLVDSTDPKSFYFRPTNEQRTVVSAAAFVHGLLEGRLNVSIDGPRERDDVIRPYTNCDRYQQLVKEGPQLIQQLENYDNSSAVQALTDAIQKRLGIPERLTVDRVISFYEFCRFYRTWQPDRQSPWCSVFTDDDLELMEYRDDVRHFYRNGYGSWVNEMLGRLPLQDLYRNFEAAVQGSGRRVTGYFTHDTMLEMTFSALGEFAEDQIEGDYMDPNRSWRTSYMSAFATNLIAVLNRCGNYTEDYKVQLYINEQPTSLCPESGCSWERFRELFQEYDSSSLDFCSMSYPGKEGSSAGLNSLGVIGFVACMALLRVL